MLVNKQLGYKNNSNLANNVQIDEGYKQKKNYSFKSLFSLFSFFSYEIFVCLFTLLNSDLKIWSAWFRYFIYVLTQYKKTQGCISFNKKAHFFWLTRYVDGWTDSLLHERTDGRTDQGTHPLTQTWRLNERKLRAGKRRNAVDSEVDTLI